MSLPLLLLVDDSEAVLAYESAALSGEYAIATATNGEEGLARMRELRPAAVLLDLSMPVMSGDEMLAQAQADAALRGIPVIVVSSEQKRAEACVRAGAVAYVAKPARAEVLRSLVGRVLAEAEKARRAGNIHVLRAGLGQRAVAVPLEQVKAVVLQPATQPLSVGPSYLGEFFMVEGAPACVVNMARALRATHAATFDERKLVLVEVGGALLGLSFDTVGDPEEVAADDVSSRSRLAPDEKLLSPAVSALVRLQSGESVPLLDPKVLMSRKVLRQIHQALQQASSEEVSP